ncbi:carbohydrate-binding module family 50 protein [Myriangium duriaei CBS 260.36]|uniref:Carbohydrate-binding module family 50 protein n=1 Tax=Myriangium duriaei CBS 260.36 TaxID=1168546 RepID=A0A9P4IXJ7_9PEZI|nr:carbohydrate-binding module family 50 protein [Myriangium duriaei CBS 260.36]
MGQVNCSFSIQADPGDTCASIASQFSISLNDFNTWNPSVGPNCSTGVVAGQSYCVEATITPISSTSTTVTTKATTTSTQSSSSTTFITVTTTTAPSGPSPTQAGLAANCLWPLKDRFLAVLTFDAGNNFYMVQSGDTCSTIVANETWNPAVGSGCSSLWLGYYVCVGVPGTPSKPTAPATTTPSGPSPTQAGLIPTCNRFYEVASGDTCAAIQAKYNTFTLQQFYSWNPAVGNTCSSLWLGYYVCIGVPGTPTTPVSSPTPTANGPQPQQPGITASCKTFYQVQSGDYCQAIADKYHVSLQQFESWNPSVGVSVSCPCWVTRDDLTRRRVGAKVFGRDTTSVWVPSTMRRGLIAIGLIGGVMQLSCNLLADNLTSGTLHDE